MAKNSVRDFDATAANNTDIQSVDIAENCAPSGINNAIRELMADIKDVSSGTIALESPQADSLTVTGDLTVDTNTLFVDASENAVGIGTTSITSLGTGITTLELKGNSASQSDRSGGIRFTRYDGSDGMYIYNADGASYIESRSTYPLLITTNGSERMRIDSSGTVLVGNTSSIGTTIAGKLQTSGIESFITTNSEVGGFIGVNSNADNSLAIGADPDSDRAGSHIAFYVDGLSEKMRIDSSGNVGIGTTSPSSYDSRTNNLVVGDSGDAGVTIFSGSTSNARLQFAPSGATGLDDGLIDYDNNNDSMSFATGGTERMRIDSGNLLVSTTSDFASGTVDGIIAQGTAKPAAAFSNTTDGQIVKFYQSGSLVGSIGTFGGDIQIGTGDNNLYFNDGATSMEPRNADGTRRDNALDMGHSSARFDDIFATNGTIQTSDQNEKQQIASLTTAEITAAKAISKLFKTFKWNDKVQAKGDAARTHAGVIAQDVQQAMTDAGLDAADYAFWCSNTWWESGDEFYNTEAEAPEGATERTRLGIRYPELLAFIGAATEQRLADIETRLTALENA